MAGSSSNSKTIPGTRREMARSRILVAISSYCASTCVQVAFSTLIVGSVKLTSGKTWPAPMVRSNPHASGLLARPNTSSDALS